MGKHVIQINGGITINVDVSVENVMYVKKMIIFGKYLISIMDELAITFDEKENKL